MELTKKRKVYDVDDFDAILVTCCDINGTARGRLVFRGSVAGVVENGLGMAQAALFFGIMCDIPEGLNEYSESGWANGTILPDLATLKPMSWLSYGPGQVGNMLCDLLDQTREREVSTSRQVAIRQIESLKALGYDIVTSYDLQFAIFHKGTLTPVGLHEDISKLVLTLMTSLSQSGFPVVSVGQGMGPGQLLISLEDQLGIAAADSLHQLHCALRSLCVKEGYDVILMTRPLHGIMGNRSNYNITLKTIDGRNVFSDPSSEDNLSVLAGHWIAGLLHHNAAITALARPTLNCYSVTENSNILQNTWTSDEQDRMCRLQIRTSGSNVFITDRLPSSASNPYIVTGAFIAAGLDGITNKLQPPEKTSATSQLQHKTPTSLSNALLSLEEDTNFHDLIGPKFVHRFLLLKREYEVKRFESTKAQDDCKDTLEIERSLYFINL